jgi:addiction module HigA family antidote
MIGQATVLALAHGNFRCSKDCLSITQIYQVVKVLFFGRFFHLGPYLHKTCVSQYRLAKYINVPARRINEIVLGKRAISADTALRLSRYFGLSERFWTNLQTRYDLEKEKDKLQDRLEKKVLVYTAA